MSDKKNIGQFDLETGEKIEGYIAVIQPRAKNGFERWMAMSQNAFATLAAAQFSGETYRVLFQMLAVLDYENWIRVSTKAVAETLGLKSQNVSRAVRKLVDAGILLPGPRVGNSATYRLNPSYGWRGSAKSHNDALQERMQAAGLKVIEGSKK